MTETSDRAADASNARVALASENAHAELSEAKRAGEVWIRALPRVHQVAAGGGLGATSHSLPGHTASSAKRPSNVRRPCGRRITSGSSDSPILQLPGLHPSDDGSPQRVPAGADDHAESGNHVEAVG
eukprot:CAMPEP_0183579050 /NCGR_PEP_ID=MMETSP0371-20130417/143021_1 /TAXON_ID=268820 /ORGANISM="Peridinium aciculiferum, Strain PAER-2" /LENGTH=126 /DNA_ID=CAMNT_0025789531 /DNA_START=184 /DNA_END=562 /DNA_ORIENTATION=+